MIIRLLYFGESLARIVNGSNHTQFTSLNNQQCMIQPIFVNLYPNEYRQRLRYFAVNLDRYLWKL